MYSLILLSFNIIRLLLLFLLRKNFI